MDVKERLELLFGAMAESKKSLARASEMVLTCQVALKSAEVAILNSYDPKMLGSNDTVRATKIRGMTSDARNDLDEAERKKREASLKYELDSLAVDCLKWQIRADLAEKGMTI